MSQRGISTVTLVIALAVAFVLVLGAAGIGAYIILRHRPTAGPAPVAPPIQPDPAPSPLAPPVQPHQPAQPPAPPAAADPITEFTLTAVTPTEVGAGEPVKFKMTFVYNGAQKTKLPFQLAWREGDGELTYGKSYEEEVTPGPNTSEGWSFRTGPEQSPGTKYRLYGVARNNEKTFITETLVVMTITGPAAQPAPPPAPAPLPPAQPAPPPAPQPAPEPIPAPPQAPQPGTNPAGPGPLQPPSPAQGLPRAGPPLAPTVEMQTYHDPGGRFAMDYPVGWRVQIVEGGFVAFFKDHPEEGTSFIVHPWATMRGTLGGREVAQLLFESARSRYPDLQVLGKDVRHLSRTGVIVDAAILEIAWTNLRGERMRGRVAIVTAFGRVPGVPSNETTIHYWSYQAPEVAWEAMARVFTQMYQSYSGTAYVTSPP